MASDSGDAWDFISEAPDFHVAMMPLLDLITFIKSMHEFLPYIADQESIRIKAIINKKKAESDHEATGECEFELEEIARRGEESSPQIIWGSVLVSIYAAFEYGVEQSFRNWKGIFRTTPNFSGRQDFIAAAEKYATTQIKIPLFPNDRYRRVMMLLKTLRNSYVHNGCRVSLLPKSIQSKLIKGELVGCRVIGDDEEAKWISDARTSLFFALEAKTIIRLFGENGFNAYDLKLKPNYPV